ncbi:MAG TPA: hypothetical protein VGS80_22750 [Ktedonobacterales bacterium]|jgi:hypothetical protein|nr:hypothetical protein [Ktedonobacterales bacterium]
MNRQISAAQRPVTMPLQRLAGFGPRAAFVSVGSLLVFIFVQQFGGAIASAAPGLYAPTAIVFVLALWVFIAGLAVLGIDLERLAPPAPNTRASQVARGATLVALVMPVPLLIGGLVYVNRLLPISYLLIFIGVGISLLLHNVAARRAGLLHGMLPWLGSATGVAYILAGIGFGTLLAPGLGTTFYLIGFNVVRLGQVLYIAWALWLGVKLSRSQAAAPAAMAPAAR